MTTDTTRTVRPAPRRIGQAGALSPISIGDADAEPPEARVFPEVDLPPITDAERDAELKAVDQISMTRQRAQAPADEPTFTRGPARRPAPRVADPLLQWASGLPTKDRQIYAGWLIECGKDETLDESMNQAGFDFVTIKHGNGKLVTHWAVETANVFVLAEGVQSFGEMRDDPTRYGIAFGWRQLENGRMQSQLRCRVLLRELLAVGYHEPLLLTVKGTVTGDLIGALTRQYEVLDTNASLRKAADKEPWDLPFYAFSIPLGPGAEVTRGTGSATKEIAPIEAKIPSPVTKEHLKAHWTKRAWVGLVEERLDDTIAWSVAESAAIAEGADERPGWEE